MVSSLKQQHPQILKASLAKNPDELFVLTITVNYEFLPEIREDIIFDKREIKPEEIEETNIRNMKNYLRNMREQVLMPSCRFPSWPTCRCCLARLSAWEMCMKSILRFLMKKPLSPGHSTSKNPPPPCWRPSSTSTTPSPRTSSPAKSSHKKDCTFTMMDSNVWVRWGLSWSKVTSMIMCSSNLRVSMRVPTLWPSRKLSQLDLQYWSFYFHYIYIFSGWNSRSISWFSVSRSFGFGNFDFRRLLSLSTSWRASVFFSSEKSLKYIQNYTILLSSSPFLSNKFIYKNYKSSSKIYIFHSSILSG